LRSAAAAAGGHHGLRLVIAMTRARALRIAALGAAWGAACQTPDRVYIEVPVAAGAVGSGADGAATGGSPASGGSVVEAGGAEPPSGGAPAATGGTAALAGGTPTSGAAGVASTGAGRASAGGSAGGVTAAEFRQRFDECTRYMVAQCQRRSDCGELQYESCLDLAIPLCPDFFFAPGAHATLETIRRCAETWRQAPCEELANPEFPGCAFDPGDRELGQRCLFNTQCAEGRCDRSKNFCGVCVPWASRGEACGPEVATCRASTACLTLCPLDGGECASLCGEPEPVGSAGLDGPCSGDIDCREGLLCLFTPDNGGTCQPKVALGAPCVVTSECLEGYCDQDAWVCTPLPGPGMPCALEARPVGLACAAGSKCDVHVNPPVCVEPGTLGEPCWVDPEDPVSFSSTCEASLACACADRLTCSGGRRCSRLVAPGDDCSFTGALCVEPAECRNGICEPDLGAEPNPNAPECGP
jgi:hypothetical protein